MNPIKLLDAQSVDGPGAAVLVAYDQVHPGLAHTITVQGTGTWNGASVGLEACADPEGEGEWSPVQYIDADGELAGIAFTDDFVVNVTLAQGVALRAVQSDSGSPAPSIAVTARGHITGAN